VAKKIRVVLTLQLAAGKATPAPPLGPILGANGVNPGQFIQQFNAATAKQNGKVCAAVVTVYSDRSFDFEIKTSPTSVLIAAALKIEKGSGKPNTEKVGKITKAQVKAIAQEKLNDLNTSNIEAAMRVVAGTARSMGVTVEG
jgi:large subunit ribosomal protein L11